MTTDKNTLKSWFRKGVKPLESNFANWIDSYWHKAEQIPTSSILGLEGTLNQKAETAETQSIRQTLDNAQQQIDGILDGNTTIPNAQYAAHLGTSSDNYTKPGLDQILAGHIKGVAYDPDNDTFIFTHENGITTEIDIPTGEAIKDARFETETSELVIVLASDQEIRVSFSGITQKCELMTSDRPGFYLVDSLGNVGMQYDNNGLDASLVSQHLKKLIADDANLQLAEINHIVTYGQSLGEGDSALPIITSAAKYANLVMFNQGVNSIQNTTPEAEKYQSFLPHVEAQWSTKGESPAAGCAEQLCLCANLNPYKQILSSNASMGATKIEQLGKGSDYYARILTDVENAYRMAKETGKSYKLLAITWTQGEFNLIANTSKAIYKTLLRQLRQDLIADLQPITGQDYTQLPFVMYQMTSTGTGAENRDIALALYELSIEEPYFHLATPIYMLQYHESSGGWHITANSSKLLGHYYGNTLAQTLANPGYETIRPLSHRIEGNDLYVKFHVPQGKLIFDTPANIASLGTIVHRGFSVKAQNNNDIVDEVQLIGNDEIKISCNTTPQGKTLNYGQRLKNDNRGQFAGELHDTCNTTAIISGEEFKLWNWCPVFQYQL